ncbi:MAG: TauD/TfdA family dioxygenase, partial [Sphingomonas fennica]
MPIPRGWRVTRTCSPSSRRPIIAPERSSAAAGTPIPPSLPAPPSVSTLYSVEVPPFGGDTAWANTALAYR